MRPDIRVEELKTESPFLGESNKWLKSQMLTYNMAVVVRLTAGHPVMISINQTTGLLY